MVVFIASSSEVNDEVKGTPLDDFYDGRGGSDLLGLDNNVPPGLADYANFDYTKLVAYLNQIPSYNDGNDVLLAGNEDISSTSIIASRIGARIGLGGETQAQLTYFDDIVYGGQGNDVLAGIRYNSTDLKNERAGYDLYTTGTYNQLFLKQNATKYDWSNDVTFDARVAGTPGTNISRDKYGSDILIGGTGADVFLAGKNDTVVDSNPKEGDIFFQLNNSGISLTRLAGEFRIRYLADFRPPAEQSPFSLGKERFNYSGNIKKLGGYLTNSDGSVIARPKPNYTNNPSIPDANEQFLEIVYNSTGLPDEALTGERAPDIDAPAGLGYEPILQRQENYVITDTNPATTTVLRFKEGIALINGAGNVFYVRNEQGTSINNGDFGINYRGGNSYLIGDNGGYDQWQRSIIADLKKGGLTEGEKQTWANIQYYLKNTLFPNVVVYRQALVAGTPAQNKPLPFYIEELDGSNRPIYPAQTPPLVSNANPLLFFLSAPLVLAIVVNFWCRLQR